MNSPPQSRPSQSQPALPGRIGPYRILRQLGVGGMAEVFAAKDSRGRIVALKSPTDSSGSQSLSREISVLKSLKDPSIVKLLGSGHDAVQNRPYAVFEMIEGEDLATALTRRGRMAVGDAARLAAKLAVTLKYVHDQGFVHLDVKPGNIMMDAGGQPVLIDFGVARRTDSTGPGGAEIGTPAYMAPEQWDGSSPIGPASDWYALGATLYHLTTGRPHLGHGTPGELAVRRRDPKRYRPPSEATPGLPKALDRLIAPLLEIDPARRLSSELDLRNLVTKWGLLSLQPPKPTEAGPDSTVQAADQPTLPNAKKRAWW